MTFMPAYMPSHVCQHFLACCQFQHIASPMLIVAPQVRMLYG